MTDERPALNPIEIAGANRARRIKRRFDAVITIEDPALPPSRRVRFHRVRHPQQLVLTFEDLDEIHESIITASESQVRAAITFARDHSAGHRQVIGHGSSASDNISRLARRCGRVRPHRVGSGSQGPESGAGDQAGLEVKGIVDRAVGREETLG